MEVTRRRLLAAVGVGALAGCTSRAPAAASGEPAATAPSGESGATAVTGETVPTAEETLPLPMDAGDLESVAVSGGPSKDGIPSIDDPSFVDAGAVDFLNPTDPVFGVALNGEIKAYPQKILVHHEIVNDQLGDHPVAVTYCPLTGTVQGFERGATTFGVSGRLINNNLIMYDRATETWWPQMLATSIPGPWNRSPGTVSLREFGLVWTAWEQWRTLHPDTQVLSTDTGFAKNYGRDPYGSYAPPRGYYANDATLFEPLAQDDRFPPKRVVMGARTADGAVAFEKSTLLAEHTMTGTLGRTPVVAVADHRLDTGYIYLNPEERTVTSDGTTASVGSATYDPGALPLTRVHTFDAMWVAWYGYYPETNVYA